MSNTLSAIRHPTCMNNNTLPVIPAFKQFSANQHCEISKIWDWSYQNNLYQSI